MRNVGWVGSWGKLYQIPHGSKRHHILLCILVFPEMSLSFFFCTMIYCPLSFKHQPKVQYLPCESGWALHIHLGFFPCKLLYGSTYLSHYLIRSFHTFILIKYLLRTYHILPRVEGAVDTMIVVAI